MSTVGKKESSLEGAWVVNTRSPRQAQQLNALLRDRGAHPVSFPCIDIVPAPDSAPLDEALSQVAEGAFQWLVFTSANAVEAVEARLDDLGISPGQLSQAMVAAVGPGTAAVLADRLDIEADLYPDEYVAEALAKELVTRRARNVLLPQAERARETLARILEASGVKVEVVTAYRTVLGSGGDDVPRLLRRGKLDAVVFASPSAVNNMSIRLERENGDWEDLHKLCIACIGPVTAAAAGRQGLRVDVMAQDHTIPGLVADLERYYRGSAEKGELEP
jgi:uroporphyrinogen-III synthase